jgi:hypothetical protein
LGAGFSPKGYPVFSGKKEGSLAKNNFQFEKRKKELAKKKRQEEKRKRKLDKKEGAAEESDIQPGDNPEQPAGEGEPV